MISKFLSDTLDLILDALAAVGLLRGGSTWFRQRMQRRMDDLAQNRENTRRAVAASHRMCRECRALIPTSESHCSSCGASMRGIPKGGAGRLLSFLFPGFGSVSMTLVGVISVIYFATAIFPPKATLWNPGEILGVLGAKYTPLIAQGEWWRLVNPIFLHGDLIHIAFNAYALANLGPIIEAQVGSRRFAVVYMLTGIFSFVASAFFSPFSPSVGASGALFGLIGFGISHGYLHARGMSAVSDQLVRWAMFGIVMILLPMRIDHFAHAGGFLMGALLGALITGRFTTNPVADRAWTVAAWLLALVLPLLGFAMALWTAFPQVSR